MALTLALVFRSRLRLLPLGVALAAAAIVFGLLGLVGGSLTMASIAVLPILIGLAVDYAIQLQARFDEAAPPPASCWGPRPRAARQQAAAPRSPPPAPATARRFPGPAASPDADDQKPAWAFSSSAS